MCGIVGIFAYGKLSDEKERKRQIAMRLIGTELLEMTKKRGEDATGVATLFENGIYTGLKMATPSTKFILRLGEDKSEYKGYLNTWRDYSHPAKIFIGHCRKSSVGNKENINNHPITAGPIVGIHNGTLKNQDIIFRNLECERAGEVDSEAIFRLLEYYTENGTKPITHDTLDEVTKRLQGTYSVLAFNANNPNQAALFRDGRPALVMLVKALNLVVVASEREFLTSLLFEYNKAAALTAFELGLPVIKQNDFEIDDITGDTGVLFNLTQEISDNTKLTDLYTKHKLPMLSEKIWKNPTTGTRSYGNNIYTNHHHSASTTQTSSTTPNLPVTTEEKKDKKAVGMAWDKDIMRFRNVYEGDTGNIGEVVINLETGDAEDIEGNIVNRSNISTSTSKKEVNDFIEWTSVDKYEDVEVRTTGHAKVSEIEDYEDITDDDLNDLLDEESSVVQLDDDNSVDVSIDRDAIVASVSASESAPTYETLKELSLDLGISVSDLFAMPSLSIVNRYVKHTYRSVFYEGYLKGKEDTFDKQKEEIKEEVHGLSMKIGTGHIKRYKRQKEKVDRANMAIRVMKELFMTTVRALQKSSGQHHAAFVANQVVGSIGEKEDLDYGIISNVFSEGDARDNELIRKTVNATKQ